MSEKEKWLGVTLQKIRDKKMQEPIMLDSGTKITNLERELQLIEKAMLHYEHPKILKHFVDKLNRLLEL
ncbi:MAG TPA: hypothetical protein VKX31_02200 [Brumimicrobium sp.]|nr:hypothetical protein [Brumimicrobium sp.]